MKATSKILVVILIVALIMNTLYMPQEIHAATTNQVSKLETSIEKQYNIKVTLSSQLSKDKNYALEALRALNEAMELMPDGLVQVMTKYYKSKGKSSVVQISISKDANMLYPASYAKETNTITLLLPGKNAYGGSGIDPNAIVHEFGHMLQYILSSKYGDKKLKSEWTAFNGSNKYGTWKEGYEAYFLGRYAAKSFGEDFAETFSAAFASPDVIREIHANNQASPIIKKCELIKSLMKSQLKFTPNVWMIYSQKPTEDVADTLMDAADQGYIDYTTSTAFQYKLSRVKYAELLEYTLRSPRDRMYETVGGFHKIYNFTDTSNECVNDLFEMGILKESSNGLFYPNAYIKRKDVAITLARALNLKNINPSTKETIKFKDCLELPANTKKCINQVVNAGLMVGTKNGSFSPDSYCTYEEIYIILNRLEEILY